MGSRRRRRRCRDWNITKERGKRVGERGEGGGEEEGASWGPRDGEKPAGCCAGKGRQRGGGSE